MSEKMSCHRWGELRFSIIGGLLSSPPDRGDLKDALEELAQKSWTHPETGGPVRFGFSTIEGWYYQARGSDNPIEELTTPPRSDSGSNKTMNAALLEYLGRQYQLHPGWGYRLHHENLNVVVKNDLSKYEKTPSYSTLRRQMKALGWTKKKRPKNPTPGQRRAYERQEKREIRSYEASHVGSLYHLDFHEASRSIVAPDGVWYRPVCFAALDDKARWCPHAQWYLQENTENLVHGFEQAVLKTGPPRALMSDRGGAMMSEEFQNGLRDLSIIHQPTLPYSPYQNAKQENFWATLEGQLMAMLENAVDLSLEQLNVYTQAWISQGYNRHFHEEIGCRPLDRFREGPDVFRAPPDVQKLRLAFSAKATRKQRKSDGTITIDGVRFEIPQHLRTFEKVVVRYRSWDLSKATVVDERTGAPLAFIFPIDKAKNASGLRRALSTPSAASYPDDIDDSERIAPLLKKMLADYSATGMPPAYLPQTKPRMSQNEGKQ